MSVSDTDQQASLAQKVQSLDRQVLLLTVAMIGLTGCVLILSRELRKGAA